MYPPQLPYGELFSPNFFYLHASVFNCVNLLWSSVRISSFCENLFLSMSISKNLFSFVRIFLNSSYLWESLLIHAHLLESFLIHRCSKRICEILLEHLFSFYSLYENKQVYGYHNLKQIFYHQNMIMIFFAFICSSLMIFTWNFSHFVSDFFFIK